MRKIINSTYITLDGAVEGPHLWPSVGSSEGEADAVQAELLESCDAVLMGRATYDSFAAVWPGRAGDPFADRMNELPKYVASTTLQNPAWNNTTVISKDLADEVARLKSESGKHIVQYGIGAVTYALLERGLVDEFRMWVHPLVLGRQGPALPHFREAPPVTLELKDSRTLRNGIAVLRYDVKKA